MKVLIRNKLLTLSILGTIHLGCLQFGGGGKGSNFMKIYRQTIEGGGVKNRLMFADVLNGWSLEVIFIFSAMQVVAWFKKETF